MNRILLAVGLLAGCLNATAVADESAPAAPKAASAMNARAFDPLYVPDKNVALRHAFDTSQMNVETGTSSGSEVYVGRLKSNGIMAATATVKIVGGVPTLTWIEVDKPFQRRGLATELYAGLKKWYGALRIEKPTTPAGVAWVKSLDETSTEAAPDAPAAPAPKSKATCHSAGVFHASGPFMSRGPARRATVGVARAGAVVVRGTARVVGRVGVAAARVAVAPVRLAARVATAPFRLVAHRRAHGCGVFQGRPCHCR